MCEQGITEESLAEQFEDLGELLADIFEYRAGVYEQIGLGALVLMRTALEEASRVRASRYLRAPSMV